MTYLDRLKKIQQKISTHRIGIAECELQYAKIISDMADEIESHKDEIDTLSDELRALKDERYLKQAY